MWKTLLNRCVKDVRFVLKPGADQHGAWRFVETKLPEIRMLNQNTFFSVTEIANQFETDSALHINYDDEDLRVETILTAGMSSEDIEKALKRRVELGLQMKRNGPTSNWERDLPVDVVEASKYVKHYDDGYVNVISQLLLFFLMSSPLISNILKC